MNWFQHYDSPAQTSSRGIQWKVDTCGLNVTITTIAWKPRWKCYLCSYNRVHEICFENKYVHFTSSLCDLKGSSQCIPNRRSWPWDAGWWCQPASVSGLADEEVLLYSVHVHMQTYIHLSDIYACIWWEAQASPYLLQYIPIYTYAYLSRICVIRGIENWIIRIHHVGIKLWVIT